MYKLQGANYTKCISNFFWDDIILNAIFVCSSFFFFSVDSKQLKAQVIDLFEFEYYLKWSVLLLHDVIEWRYYASSDTALTGMLDRFICVIYPLINDVDAIRSMCTFPVFLWIVNESSSCAKKQFVVPLPFWITKHCERSFIVRCFVVNYAILKWYSNNQIHCLPLFLVALKCLMFHIVPWSIGCWKFAKID